MATALEYARERNSRFIEQLEALAGIKSVSTDKEYESEVRRAAEWLAEDMRAAGLRDVEVSPTDGHPVVYGQWLEAGEDAPTVLLYAHYDVQPASKEDGWDTDPFVPTRKNGKIYARGIGDDKLHSVMIVKLAEAFLKSDEPCPVNLRLVIEGEEEVGSPNFAPWVRANKERLRADYCLLCDGGIDNPEQPTVNYALRGMLAMEITVRGPRADLHSGVHGGRVHNPAQVIAEMVSKLHDETGRVSVPGFYEEVRELGDDERAELNADPMTPQDFAESVGAPEPWGEPDYTLVERATSRPTLEINGIYGGYTGEGMKTVIPAQASAKITCRLVENQKPDTIYRRIAEYLEQIKPPTVELHIDRQGSADPVVVPTDSPLVRALVAAYKHHWDVTPRFRRIGGTIPIAPVVQNELGLPSLLVGFNVSNAGFHGPNEFIHAELFPKGLDTLIVLMQRLARG
jgi:acetylornithine deacetylase/succinyl-diaminopimelate desuccinylase-like protein